MFLENGFESKENETREILSFIEFPFRLLSPSPKNKEWTHIIESCYDTERVLYDIVICIPFEDRIFLTSSKENGRHIMGIQERWTVFASEKVS